MKLVVQLFEIRWAWHEGLLWRCEWQEHWPIRCDAVEALGPMEKPS